MEEDLGEWIKCDYCEGTGTHESPGYYYGVAECPSCEGAGGQYEKEMVDD